MKNIKYLIFLLTLALPVLLFVPKQVLAQVDFTWNGSCAGSPTQFTSIADTASTTDYNWNFGDGFASGIQNPVHTYTAPGTYATVLIVTDTLGDTASVTHQVIIKPLPVAHFSVQGLQCSAATVQFDDLSVTDSGYIVKWLWDFGDGNSQTVIFPANPDVTHMYANAGTYNVSLTITTSDSCSATEVQALTIYPQPLADFMFLPACSGHPTQFTDLSLPNGSGFIVQWQWNFGDPASGAANTSTLQNPIHAFTAAGTFLVQLIATSSSGCQDTIVKPLLVNALPDVDFDVSNSCVNEAVAFAPNDSVMNPGIIVNWLWNFGDGNTSNLQSPVHIFTTPGTYNVTLSVNDTNTCFNSASKQIVIYSIPTAGFTSSYPVCANSAIAFTDMSQNTGGGSIISWLWNFGDPASGSANTSVMQNATHTFASPGLYNVSLTVSNSTACTSITVFNIQVSQKPSAGFTFTEPQLNVPVQFTDLSVPGSGTIFSRSWDFGDGNISTFQNPVHTYPIPGTYSISLFATNTGGCSNFVDSTLIVPAGAVISTITGKVFAGAETISNATVRLIKVDNQGLPLSTVITNPGANNEFVFTNIPTGFYYLHAYPQTSGPFADLFLPGFFTNSVFWQTAEIINLGQAQNPYDIQLATYQIIKGGTFTINGQIVNYGRAINPAQQEVLLFDSENKPVRWTFTDMSGHFSFDSLPAGTYGINPVISGHTTYPYYVVLNAGTSPAFVKMYIMGQIITNQDKTVTAKQSFSIYPNPASTSITISSDEQIQKLVISNSLGKTLLQVDKPSNNSKVDISAFAPGIIFVKIVTSTQQSTQKVIVTH